MLISECGLSFSLISGLIPENYQNIECSEADFTSAIIDDKDLASYLRENNAKNLSGAISDTTEFRTKLKEIKGEQKVSKRIFAILCGTTV